MRHLVHVYMLQASTFDLPNDIVLQCTTGDIQELPATCKKVKKDGKYKHVLIPYFYCMPTQTKKGMPLLMDLKMHELTFLTSFP